MATATHRPVVMAPVRRRRRLSGLSAEAAIAAQVLGFRTGIGKTAHPRQEQDFMFFDQVGFG